MKADVYGTSVIGAGHLEDGTPCQDSNSFGNYRDWSFLIVSDGAGSCSKSHLGSALAVQQSELFIKRLIDRYPGLSITQSDWVLISHRIFSKIRQRIIRTSRQLDYDPQELSSTLILIIHNKEKLFVAHVGDGRAGAKIDGDWRSIINPYQGESLSSTCFLMSKGWDAPGIFQAECLEGTVDAVVALSDGCEKACWIIDEFDSTERKTVKVNQPFKPFFEYILQDVIGSYSVKSFRERRFRHFIEEGNDVLRNQRDDKTMIISHFIKP